MKKHIAIPDELPIVPLKKHTVFPSTIADIEIEQEAAFRLLDDVRNGDRLLMIVAQKDTERHLTNLGDIFRVGTAVRLPLMEHALEGKFSISVLGLERVMIGELTQEQPYFVAHIALKPDLEEAQNETKARLRRMIPSFRRLVALSQKMPEHVIWPHLEAKDPREAVYTMASFAEMDLEHEQQLLELDTVSTRIQHLHSYITAELEQFEQSRQAAYGSSQNRDRQNMLDEALHALNVADT